MKRIKLYIKMLVAVAAFWGASTVAFADPAAETTLQVAGAQPQVRVLGSEIEITIPGEEDRNVTIYALTGQVIKSFNAAPGVTLVELPKGYYIVKCDRISCRVIVK